MPVKINCPNCSKELNAPDALIGKLAACPRCGTQFPVTLQPQAVGTGPVAPPRSVTPNYYPPGAGPRVETPAKTSVSESVAPQPAAPQQIAPPRTAQPILQRPPDPPTTPPAPPTAKPFAAPPSSSQMAVPIPTVARPISPSPTNGPPLSPPLPPQAPPVAAQPTPMTPTASPLRKPTDRKVQAARFVSGGAMTTRINLGEDGKLPDLVVDDEAHRKSEKAEAPSEQGRPLLLALALSVSVAMSLLMFFVPQEEEEAKSKKKADARLHIEKHYLGDGANLKPYEKLLRDALVSSRHGDELGAKRRYRKVLDMLHAEDHGSPIGLVGRKANTSPPSDHDLKDQLKILLSDR